MSAILSYQRRNKQLKLTGSILRCFSDIKRHYERKLISQPIELLYEVVSDVDNYKNFVPWCKQSRVLIKNKEYMEAELEVGFSLYSERYTSTINLLKPSSVIATSTDTKLFNYLKTNWKFVPAKNPATTWVVFEVEFQFKSSLYNEVSKLFMQEVTSKMVTAFEQRCVLISSKERKINNL